MKKFINKPEDFVDEMIDGIVSAHPKLVKYVADNRRCIVNENLRSKEKSELRQAAVRGICHYF